MKAWVVSRTKDVPEHFRYLWKTCDRELIGPRLAKLCASVQSWSIEKDGTCLQSSFTENVGVGLTSITPTTNTERVTVAGTELEEGTRIMFTKLRR